MDQTVSHFSHVVFCTSLHIAFTNMFFSVLRRIDKLLWQCRVSICPLLTKGLRTATLRAAFSSERLHSEPEPGAQVSASITGPAHTKPAVFYSFINPTPELNSAVIKVESSYSGKIMCYVRIRARQQKTGKK